MKIIAISLSQLLATLAASQTARAAEQDRKIARYDGANGLIVSTIKYPDDMTDGEPLYATGVCHPEYPRAPWESEVIVVGEYRDLETARLGHDAWVKLMTSKTLPASLRDVSTVFPEFRGTVHRVLEMPRGDLDDFNGEEDTQPSVPTCVIR